MINTIYWIRHGQSVANTHKFLHPIYLDPPLTELGQEQMSNVGRALFDEDIEIIICSPLIRSIESAKIIQSYIKFHGKNCPKLVMLPSLCEKGIGLDNVSIHSLLYCKKPITFIQNVFKVSQFKIFEQKLIEIAGTYKKIAIVGHENINNEYIKKLADQEIPSMKNGEIVKLTMSDNKIVALENYLRRY